MYKGKNDEVYGDLEETILACILIKPKLIETLTVTEKQFRKFGYMLTFFRLFYHKHKCLDITLMFAELKDSQTPSFLDMITYLTTVFALPSNIKEYERALIEIYQKDKREDWLRKKIYEKATSLYFGEMSIDKFNADLKGLYDYAKKVEWK